MPLRLGLLVTAFAALAAACNQATQPPTLSEDGPPAPAPATTAAPVPTVPAPPTTVTAVPPPDPIATLSGTVLTPAGLPLGAAVVAVSGQTATTAEDGTFSIEAAPGPIAISRPGWLPAVRAWTEYSERLEVTLQPRQIRGLRVSRYVASDRDAFAELLSLARQSSVNALVFDTKDETGEILYNTGVREAYDLGAVNPKYLPQELIGLAKEAGLYTITRIVTFEDPIRANADRDAKLAGAWIDMEDPANWEYPLALGVEACELGFEEIQFDYVRWPAGLTATFIDPTTQSQRVSAIVGFLTEARSRINPLGCAVAADIFGIVLSSPDDQGVGQRAEELSQAVDVVSPMIYPSHYSDGWLGFSSPNDFPGPVVSDALDDGAPRLVGTAVLRPWLQAFFYSPDQILTEIDETEDRGYGWMLWNAGGEYAAAALPDPVLDPADLGMVARA